MVGGAKFADFARPSTGGSATRMGRQILGTSPRMTAVGLGPGAEHAHAGVAWLSGSIKGDRPCRA
jgi:hypothetical protein